MHSLPGGGRGTCQDMERNLSEGHSHSGEHKEKARSGDVRNMRVKREGNGRNQPIKYGSERTD